MILRAELGGHSFDLRYGQRWGLGAEILLRRKHGDTQMVEKSVTEVPDDASSTVPFSEESFAITRDYYERLILQYPYRRLLPDATSSLNILPAMFGLWIRRILGRGKMTVPILTSDSANQANQRHAPYTNHQSCPEEAQELIDRLDDMLASPPYSEKAWFWQLKAMIFLWIADVLQSNEQLGCSGKRPHKRFHEMTTPDWEILRGASSLDSTQSNIKASQVSWQTAFLIAKNALEKASHCSDSKRASIVHA